ncbi:MAG: sugar transferase, partial [Verrucomicrobia bacterium]|nr:sugar transferase [Verrucomicrobiota bacterium]
VRAAVWHGEAWGVRVEAHPEQRELTVAEARAKYQTKGPEGWMPAPNDVVLLDRLPGGERSLLDNHGDWFNALLGAMSEAVEDRIGMREFAPNIFVGLRSQISQGARLEAPCWIGNHTWIGAGTKIGPNTIVESGCYVDANAEVVDSFIGPDTYVGALTEVRESFAWGHGLLKWKTGVFSEVADDFLLCDLTSRAKLQRRRASLAEKAAAMLALLLTWPAPLIGWLRNRRSGKPLLTPLLAVRAPLVGDGKLMETYRYYELAGFSGLWKRWPELFCIARGDAAWVGNRPLTPAQAKTLKDDHERLWLSVPPGLFSLADVMGCAEAFGEDAKVHASFYAAHRSWRKDFEIMDHILKRFFKGGTA